MHLWLIWNGIVYKISFPFIHIWEWMHFTLKWSKKYYLKLLKVIRMQFLNLEDSGYSKEIKSKYMIKSLK